MNISQLVEGKVWTLWIEGELDAVSSPTLRRAVDARLGDGIERVVLNLSGLTSIDTSGIAALVGLYKRVREREGELRMTGLHGAPRAVFKMFGLDRVFSDAREGPERGGELRAF